MATGAIKINFRTIGEKAMQVEIISALAVTIREAVSTGILTIVVVGAILATVAFIRSSL